MIILVDMDGTIADFEKGFLNTWRKLHSHKKWIPLEARTTHYIVHQYPAHYRDDVETILHACGFYRHLDPIPGSIEALQEMRDSGYEVFICSTPMEDYTNCVLEKYEWVATHLGSYWTNRMILTRDKTLVKGDVLIDDKPEIAGVVTPTWKQILYDQPYNRCTRMQRLTWRNWREQLNLLPCQHKLITPVSRPPAQKPTSLLASQQYDIGLP